ncbi:MAG: hypothetical protein ACYCVB_14905 [Bacilli bacterium]
MILTALILCAIAAIQYFASMRQRNAGEKITFGVSWAAAVAASLLGLVADKSMDVTSLLEPSLGHFMHTVYEQWLK